MKALADYIHGKGLKAGIYTSPGPWTCGGYVGAYQHEAHRCAGKFAEWGFDFLKYDWCSYGERGRRQDRRTICKKPYRLMWGELPEARSRHRFQPLPVRHGRRLEMGRRGRPLLAHHRRSGPRARTRSLPGFYNIGLSNARHWQYARPGAWNDPDYILIGWVGDAHGMGEGQQTDRSRPTSSTAYMSMWSLMAAPLIFSGDMAKLDAFTLNVLCNPEVIDVDQDPLGKQAQDRPPDAAMNSCWSRNWRTARRRWACSTSRRVRGIITVAWNDLGLSGKRQVRDLWRQKGIGSFNQALEIEVPRHGVALVRLQPGK